MDNDELRQRHEELADSRDVLQAKRRRIQQLREDSLSDRIDSNDDITAKQCASSELKHRANGLRAASQMLKKQTHDLRAASGKTVLAREGNLKREEALMSMHERIQDQREE